MATKFSFIGTIITGGLAGTFGVSLAFVLWTVLFQPKLFGDGQYGMVFWSSSHWAGSLAQ